MGKSFVRFRHPVDSVALFHRRPFAVVGVNDFVRQFDGHRLAFAGGSRVHQPPAGQIITAGAAHLVRNLIIGSADPTAADFQKRRNSFDRLVENMASVLLGLLFDDLK